MTLIDLRVLPAKESFTELLTPTTSFPFLARHSQLVDFQVASVFFAGLEIAIGN